jgi:hypothetical protein
MWATQRKAHLIARKSLRSQIDPPSRSAAPVVHPEPASHKTCCENSNEPQPLGSFDIKPEDVKVSRASVLENEQQGEDHDDPADDTPRG